MKTIEDFLTSLSGISRKEARKQKICTWCKKPITQFRDELSVREYGISGFCQDCQDRTFGSEE
jgi:hypothetical protein